MKDGLELDAYAGYEHVSLSNWTKNSKYYFGLFFKANQWMETGQEQVEK